MTAMAVNTFKPVDVVAGRPVGVTRTHHIVATVCYVIVVAASLCLSLTGCTVSTSGRPAAARDLGHWQSPPILNPRLGEVLLSSNDVNAVGQTATMALRQQISEMSHNEGVVADRNCLDVYSPLEAAVYQGSSWAALQGQLLDNAHSLVDKQKHALLQAVVGFRNADSAQQFFSEAKPRWSACANRPLTTTQPGDDPVTWSLGDLVATDTTLTIMHALHGGNGFACQRAMGVRNNVIIETLWCGFDTANQGGEVVNKIAAAVSHA